MSTDLKYLALTAMLTASLWISYIAAQVITNGSPRPAKLRRSGAASGAALGQARGPRLHQCRRNVRAVRGAGDPRSTDRQGRCDDGVLGAVVFWLRVAHGVVYRAAIPYIRTVVFTLGYVS